MSAPTSTTCGRREQRGDVVRACFAGWPVRESERRPPRLLQGSARRRSPCPPWTRAAAARASKRQQSLPGCDPPLRCPWSACGAASVDAVGGFMFGGSRERATAPLPGNHHSHHAACARLLTMRPMGVVLKKDMGARSRRRSMLPCRLSEATICGAEVETRCGHASAAQMHRTSPPLPPRPSPAPTDRRLSRN